MRGTSQAGPQAVDFGAATLWIIDLDGVIWLTGEPIGDVAQAIADLRAHGVRVAFATNNSAPTTDELVARLDRIGIPAGADDLVSSAGAAASLLHSGQRAHVLAEQGVLEALAARHVGVVVGNDGAPAVHDDAEPVDAVVVGWNRTFDFDSLAAAATAARRAGRLIATNEDPTHPTPEGLMPGSGALLAAVATASGVRPEVAGKPHAPMATLMTARFGFEVGDASAVMIGDQPRTDGALAARLKIPFGLVDSGVTPATATEFDVPVGLRCPDFVTLVRTALGGSTR